MPTFTTIDNYIANQPKETQIALEGLRSIIKEAAPGVEEVINYKVPSFRLVSNGKATNKL